MAIQKFDNWYAIEPFDKLRVTKVAVFIKTYRLATYRLNRLTDLPLRDLPLYLTNTIQHQFAQTARAHRDNVR